MCFSGDVRKLLWCLSVTETVMLITNMTKEEQEAMNCSPASLFLKKYNAEATGQ